MARMLPEEIHARAAADGETDFGERIDEVRRRLLAGLTRARLKAALVCSEKAAAGIEERLR